MTSSNREQDSAYEFELGSHEIRDNVLVEKDIHSQTYNYKTCVTPFHLLAEGGKEESLEAVITSVVKKRGYAVEILQRYRERQRMDGL